MLLYQADGRCEALCVAKASHMSMGHKPPQLLVPCTVHLCCPLAAEACGAVSSDQPISGTPNLHTSQQEQWRQQRSASPSGYMVKQHNLHVAVVIHLSACAVISWV